MKEENSQEMKSGLFDQIIFKSENINLTRRKVSEAMQGVRNWFSQQESLPPEFKNLNIMSDNERSRNVWQKHF